MNVTLITFECYLVLKIYFQSRYQNSSDQTGIKFYHLNLDFPLIFSFHHLHKEFSSAYKLHHSTLVSKTC